MKYFQRANPREARARKVAEYHRKQSERKFCEKKLEKNDVEETVFKMKPVVHVEKIPVDSSPEMPNVHWDTDSSSETSDNHVYDLKNTFVDDAEYSIADETDIASLPQERATEDTHEGDAHKRGIDPQEGCDSSKTEENTIPRSVSTDQREPTFAQSVLKALLLDDTPYRRSARHIRNRINLPELESVVESGETSTSSCTSSSTTDSSVGSTTHAFTDAIITALLLDEDEISYCSQVDDSPTIDAPTMNTPKTINAATIDASTYDTPPIEKRTRTKPMDPPGITLDDVAYCSSARESRNRQCPTCGAVVA